MNFREGFCITIGERLCFCVIGDAISLYSFFQFSFFLFVMSIQLFGTFFFGLYHAVTCTYLNLFFSMAEDAVDAAIKSGKLNPINECLTQKLRIVGGEGWDPASFTVLAQQYIRMKKSHSGKVVPGVMDTAAAKHLSHAYGTMAEKVAIIAQVGFSCSKLQ